MFADSFHLVSKIAAISTTTANSVVSGSFTVESWGFDETSGFSSLAPEIVTVQGLFYVSARMR